MSRPYLRPAGSCIIPFMSDTHDRPTLSRSFEQEHPYAGLEPYRNTEVERHDSKERSSTKLWVGSTGLAANVLVLWVLANFTLGIFSVVFAVGLILVLVASMSSIWLFSEGRRGLKGSRPLAPPRKHRAIRGSDQAKSAERQLLEVMERNGEITPARAALQTSLTVEEAERLLSDLAQRGHLDVRVEGSKLVYAL